MERFRRDRSRADALEAVIGAPAGHLLDDLEIDEHARMATKTSTTNSNGTVAHVVHKWRCVDSDLAHGLHPKIVRVDEVSDPHLITCMQLSIIQTRLLMHSAACKPLLK